MLHAISCECMNCMDPVAAVCQYNVKLPRFHKAGGLFIMLMNCLVLKKDLV
jgi:hypothetical protein